MGFRQGQGVLAACLRVRYVLIEGIEEKCINVRTSGFNHSLLVGISDTPDHCYWSISYSTPNINFIVEYCSH